jgi:hypothetical protein
MADGVGFVLQWYYELNCKIEAVCKFFPLMKDGEEDTDA